jgi:hypothetical protein
MNRNKAISILKNQIEKIKTPEGKTSEWSMQTKSYVKSFFGEDSIQFEYFQTFSFFSTYTYDPVLFLNECIEFIKNNGLYKVPKKNFLESLPNWLIMLLIPALFSAGLAIGKYTSDLQNIELKRELKELKNNKSLIPDTSANHITKKIEYNNENPKNK